MTLDFYTVYWCDVHSAVALAYQCPVMGFMEVSGGNWWFTRAVDSAPERTIRAAIVATTDDSVTLRETQEDPESSVMTYTLRVLTLDLWKSLPDTLQSPYGVDFARTEDLQTAIWQDWMSSGDRDITTEMVRAAHS